MAVYASTKGLNCRSCTLQEYLGCDKDLCSPVDVWGFRVTRCAKKLSTPMDYLYIQIYGEWKKGILPNEGGWLDQPMKFGTIMNTIDGLMDKVEKE